MDVLITGASRGIGRAIAIRLAQDGARIVFNYLQNEPAALETIADIQAAGGEAYALSADVRSPDALKMLVAEAGSRLGGIDLLVHNAAMGALKPMEKMRTNQWDLTLESSLRPFWLLSKLCLPLLREGSSIIGITSLGSRKYTPGYAAMGASKGGVEALVRQFAVELAPKTRVNAVCGGLIETAVLKYLPEAEQLVEHVKQATPLARIGQPSDIAGVVAMLASEDARWINGQVVVADGGLSAV